MKDLSHLPPAEPTDGVRPIRDHKAHRSLLKAWMDNYNDSGKADLPLAIPEAGPFRASFSGNRCDRALFYALAGVDKTNPPDIASYWVFEMGHYVHDTLQAAALRAWPGAEIEVKADLRPIGIDGSASVDVAVFSNVMDLVGDRSVERKCLFNVEIKSTGGYSYKAQCVDFNGAPQGPKWSAIVQGALANRALGADRMLIMVAATENVSVQIAKQKGIPIDARFLSTFEYTAEQCRLIVEAETMRVNRIAGFVGTDVMPRRELSDPEYPVGAVVQSPDMGGMWTHEVGGKIVQTGKTWMCAYCDWQDRCLQDGAS